MLCFQDELIHLKFTAHQLQTSLEKYHVSKNRSRSVTSGTLQNEKGDRFPQKLFGPSRRQRERWAQDGSSSSRSSNDAGDVPVQDLQLPAAFLQRMVPAQHVTFSNNARRAKRAFNPADRQSYGE